MDRNDRPTNDPAAYWGSATKPFLEQAQHRSWRSYCDLVHGELVRAWAPAHGARRVLKTDAFDEAAGTGLGEVLGEIAHEVHLVDVATPVVAAAVRADAGALGLVADIRRLPYPAGAFDVVLSNSTLDHFADRTDIVRALRELARVIESGGVLVVTLDNPWHPVVALRSVLPSRLLARSGLVPYFTGATLSLRSLCRELESAGFRIDGTTTLVHVPRVLAMPIADRADRRGARQDDVVRRLRSWDRLGHLPTRQLTGHFVAARAVRR